MPADDFYPNGWPKEHCAFDTGSADELRGPTDPLIAAICRIKNTCPAKLSGRDRAKAEKVITDGLSESRFIEIINATIESGGKWQQAVMQAWEEVKERGKAAAKSAGTSVFIKATNYNAEKERAWATKPPLDRAKQTIALCEGWLATGKFPPGKDRGDVNMMLRRAKRELELWSKVT